MLEFRILGPIEVRGTDDPIEIRGKFQRTLLATLLVNSGKIVSKHSLMEELWGADPPRNADNALQAHMSRLRRCLDPAEPERPSTRLVSTPSGYRLCIDDDELDADTFIRAVKQVEVRDNLDSFSVVTLLRRALALYHGPVFGGPIGGLVCQVAAVRYEEYRCEALALLFENELLVGRHSEITAELSGLVESEPLNERLSQQLMIALYRSGRQTSALAVYRRIRARLIEELGLQPSPNLRHCEWAILSHDPTLAGRVDYPLASNG